MAQMGNENALEQRKKKGDKEIKMWRSLHFGITAPMFSFWFSFSFSSFGSFIQVICPFLFSRVCLLISVYLYVCSMFSWFSVIFHCIIFILFSGCYCCSFAIFRSQHSVIICCYITLHYNSSNSIPWYSPFYSLIFPSVSLCLFCLFVFYSLSHNAALSLHSHLNELMIIRVSHECRCQIPMLN